MSKIRGQGPACLFDLGTINLQLVGWILAAAGLLGLIASVAISRRAVVSRREVYPPDERF